MPTPFPGMDPYLERRGLWEEIHTNLIVGIRHHLTPILRPRYRVAIQKLELGKLLLTEEITERSLEIQDTATHEVITAIEIITSTNKESQEGRQQYEAKRRKVLASATSLVEIDLLRGGKPFAMRVGNSGEEKLSDYRIVISRSWQRPSADIYLFSLRQRIPSFLIPLRPGEQEPVLPLNQILHDLYDQGGYDMAIDYHEAADPPLTQQDIDWVTEFL